MMKQAIERDAIGNKIVVPLGFSNTKEEFAYLRKIENCQCLTKGEKTVCEVYSYIDEDRVPCVKNGIDEIILQDLKTDKKISLKKAKNPSQPIFCEEAVRLIKDQGISMSTMGLSQFPAMLRGDQYKASVKIIPKSTYNDGDRVNYSGEETHEIIFSSSIGEKKIGEFKNCCGWRSAISSDVVGFLQIPNSDRLVVVTSVVSRVFEEETTERIQFWGASLVDGFTKKAMKKKK
jgi:hypothetical protein